MDQYILLAETENTFFILHEQKPESKKEHLYNVYRAFDHLKLLNDKDSTVLIFNLLDDENMDIISIQHKLASVIRSYEKKNMEDVFNSLKHMDSSRQIFVLNYHFEKEMYETVVLNGKLEVNKELKLQNIEYVQYVGEEEESTTVQDDLSQPLQLNIEDPVAAEEPKVEEPTAEEQPVAAEEPTVEEPKVEEPKVEEPPVEEPVAAEEPTVEEPKVEEPLRARSYKYG